MIGNLNPKYREATVVGAGIAGLLAAYALDKKNYKVSLIEQNTRVGGLIATRTTAWGIAEQAAHSFLASQSVLELCRDLKIELLGLNRNAKAKY
ncbi:MAG: NAD(P)-binding protein, partial [Bdellovibrio sp.]|nr:NAD(P)-binding protein [Bdellovibrio sp.]